jgi:CubicO group peptidase (beta-lactamase class C family)
VLRYIIQERTKALNVNGVSVAVIRNYDIELARRAMVSPDVETKRPVTAETLLLAGSISKPMAPDMLGSIPGTARFMRRGTGH